LKLVRGTFRYIVHRGLIRVGHVQALQATSLPDAQTPGEERGFALFVLGSHALSLGRVIESQEVLLTARQEAQRLGLEQILSLTLQPLAHVSMELGQDDQARAYLSEAVDTARKTGATFETMAALSLLGQFQRTKGEYRDAFKTFTEALALCARLGDETSSCILQLNLAMVTLDSDQLPECANWLRSICDFIQGESGKQLQPSFLDCAAAYAIATGQLSLATLLTKAANEEWERSGTARDVADQEFVRRWASKLPEESIGAQAAYDPAPDPMASARLALRLG
jgi:tetratricopeptide (TPR) repeat protein